MVLHSILNALAALALTTAKFGAGAASMFNRYQPELPVQLGPEIQNSKNRETLFVSLLLCKKSYLKYLFKS